MHAKTNSTVRGKKPVGRTLICNQTYVRRIDPIWSPGPVPRGFWDETTHRRDYLIWLGHRLRFRWMEDFYRLNTRMMTAHYGSHVARIHWRSSSCGAVKDCFPQYDWQEWMFARAPVGFWESRANCRRYLRWLGTRLGYHSLDDWYGVSYHDFARNKGLSLLMRYRGSPALTVIDLLPRRDWCPWKFLHVPPGFWERAENRHRYLRWLGRQLGFRRPEDWYGIGQKDVTAHFGIGLLGRRCSLYGLMREFLPQLDWERHWRRWRVGVDQILQWADAYEAQHGDWPTLLSGAISGTDTTWASVAPSESTENKPAASWATRKTNAWTERSGPALTVWQSAALALSAAYLPLPGGHLLHNLHLTKCQRFRSGHMVTVHDEQHLQVTQNNVKNSIDMIIPYTCGLWEKTKPVEVTLVQGKNTLSFSKPTTSFALKDLTLTPVK